MSLHNSDRRGKKIIRFTYLILEMSDKGKVQAGFPARGEYDECWRTHACLRDVLDAQTRAAVGLGGDDAASSRDCTLKEFVQLRSRNASAARFVPANRQRQELR